jgi:hypothetical protein
VNSRKTVKFTNFPLLFFSVKDLACLTVFSKLPELPWSQSIWLYCHLGNSKPLTNAFCVLDLWKHLNRSESWRALWNRVFWFSQ